MKTWRQAVQSFWWTLQKTLRRQRDDLSEMWAPWKACCPESPRILLHHSQFPWRLLHHPEYPRRKPHRPVYHRILPYCPGVCQTSLCTRFTCVVARGYAGRTRHVYSQKRTWLPQTAVRASAGRTTLMPHWPLGASHGHLSLRQRARHNLTKNLQMLWFGLKLIFYNCTLESFFVI